MNNRYALFAGHNYYPNGGFEDFKAFGTLDELKAMRNKLEGMDWAHIADLEARRIVLVVYRPMRSEWEEPSEFDQPEPLQIEGDEFAGKGK